MRFVLILGLVGCSGGDNPVSAPVSTTAYQPQQASAALVDEQCADPPVSTHTPFRHRRSALVIALGDPRHRGIDLVARVDDAEHHLAGKVAYGKVDKDLQDEEVELYACIARAWASLGRARTDGDGRFELVLSGTRRLPPGMRDLYLQVPGDGTGVSFLAFVATAADRIVVTDVDGTLTESENAVIGEVIAGAEVDHRVNAPPALQRSPWPIVYLTARGDNLTEPTRRWLREHRFPRGPLRLSHDFITLPGEKQLAWKTAALRALRVPIAAGIGNRATDIVAYREAAGLAPEHILIFRTEKADEVRDDLANGRARGFDDYRDLPPLLR